MANTLIPIQTYTLTSTASSVTFSNIPQNYIDLKLVVSARATTGETFGQLKINPNGSTSNNTRKNFGTFGSTAINTYTDTDRMVGYVNGDSSTTSTFSNTEVYFTNYTSANYKSYSSDTVIENNSASVYSTTMYANLWSSTSAITSLEIVVVNSSQATCSFNIGSTFTLYGISNGVKATGGTLTVAGGYAYHTFTSTGSFLPNQKIKGAEVLVIAGGGGGSFGGGGAGGLRYVPYLALTAATNYIALVGSGGTGSQLFSSSTPPTNGTDSVFSSVVSTGGGYGGGLSSNSGAGNSGGSGGGSGHGTASDGSVVTTFGTGSSGQGNNGGNGYANPYYGGGGGGGASSVGSNATTAVGGNGGSGTNVYTAWHSITSTGVLSGGMYYVAGGGGGAYLSSGGLGGGGYSSSAANANDAASGTANTGGGGGGTNSSGALNGKAGNGGSGLIIVRYPLS